MKDKKKIIIISLVISIIVIVTVGVTFAFFTYVKEGTKEHTITSGSITFKYIETSRGLTLSDAMPMTDTEGKGQTDYFDFKIESKPGNSNTIPYYITVRKTDNDNTLNNEIKLYLSKTKIENEVITEQQVALTKFKDLSLYTNSEIDLSGYNERLLYTTRVPVGSNYTQSYRLRMWIDENADYIENDYNNKSFSIQVNVYGNGQALSENEINNANTSTINNVGVNGTNLIETSGEYNAEVDEGTTSAIVNVETESPYDTIKIEKTDSTYTNLITMNEVPTIQKISLTQNRTVELTNGDNYFKITSISETGEGTTIKKLHIKVMKNGDNSLASLSIDNCPFKTDYNKDTLSYSCTLGEYRQSLTVNAQVNNIKSTITSTTGTTGLVVGSNTVKVTVKAEDDTTRTYTITVTNPNETVNILGKNYSVATDTPNLKAVYTGTGKVYKSTATNSGSPTYYFRGNVTNNYVNFAGLTWRIIRKNEDGTTRLILEDRINATSIKFNSSSSAWSNVYYSNSPIKSTMNTWYTNNIAKVISGTKKYSDYVESGNYFCEAARVVNTSNGAKINKANLVGIDSYTPTFKCTADGNSKGVVNASIAFITYDELVFAGAYSGQKSDSMYLRKNYSYWTMSPHSFDSSAKVWSWYGSSSTNRLQSATPVSNVNNMFARPVINLKSTVTATGTGTSGDPFRIVYE